MNGLETLSRIDMKLAICVVILALAVAVNARSRNQARRASGAVVAAVIVPVTSALMVKDRAVEVGVTWYWIASSAAQIGVCMFLAVMHLRQMQEDAETYHCDFLEPSEGALAEIETQDSDSRTNKNFHLLPKRPRTSPGLSIEGQSSFTVLLWGIYGIAALFGSVITYFTTAQFAPLKDVKDSFVFVNNEGFIAALTLLIIVVSGAAVPIYTDLAKQVRAELDAFEQQISSLHRAAVNISDHGDALWSHFYSASQAAIRSWSLTRDQVQRSAHDVLLTPFLYMKSGQGLNEISDDELFRKSAEDDPKVDILYSNCDRISPEEGLRGWDACYLATPDLAPTKERIRKNRLFQAFHSVSIDSASLVREIERELPAGDRLQRIRRLRYLSWLAQGDLARATGGEAKGRFTVEPIVKPQPWSLVATSTPDSSKGLGASGWSEEFKKTRQGLVVPSENVMVAILRRSLPFEVTEHGTETFNSLEKLAAEYRERASRHLHKWESFLRPALIKACDSLDLDIGPLADDVILFEQLAMTKIDYRCGSLARFIYFGHWLNGLSEPDSKISELISVIEQSPSADRKEPRRHANDVHDVRDSLMRLTRSVMAFVDDPKPAEKDVISAGLSRLSLDVNEKWILDEFVFYLDISEKWCRQVRTGSDAAVNMSERWSFKGEAFVKQVAFLRWIVWVLGTDEDKRGLEKISGEALVEMALRQVNPRSRRRHEKLQHPDKQLEDLTEDEYQTQLSEIKKRIRSYCLDEKNSGDLQTAFFDTTQPDNFQEWRKRFESRSAAPTNNNQTRELLLLTLADHKSALFNWMRAARAVEIRERVARFHHDVVRQRNNPKRQLGIEVVPSRHDRLRHLRDCLGFVGQYKPLQARSIYSSEPTPVKSFEVRTLEMERIKQRQKIYTPYLALMHFMNISKKWADAVRIRNSITYWAYQRQFEASNRAMPDGTFHDRELRFFKWIVRVLGTEGEKGGLEQLSTEELVLSALRLVNPHSQRREEQLQFPDRMLKDLTKTEYRKQSKKILQKVASYCLNKDNANDLKETFFDGSAAEERYLEWYEKLNRRSSKGAPARGSRRRVRPLDAAARDGD